MTGKEKGTERNPAKNGRKLKDSMRVGIKAQLLNTIRIKKSLSKSKNGLRRPHRKGLLVKLVLDSSGYYLL